MNYKTGFLWLKTFPWEEGKGPVDRGAEESDIWVTLSASVPPCPVSFFLIYHSIHSKLWPNSSHQSVCIWEASKFLLCAIQAWFPTSLADFSTSGRKYPRLCQDLDCTGPQHGTTAPKVAFLPTEFSRSPTRNDCLAPPTKSRSSTQLWLPVATSKWNLELRDSIWCLGLGRGFVDFSINSDLINTDPWGISTTCGRPSQARAEEFDYTEAEARVSMGKRMNNK